MRVTKIFAGLMNIKPTEDPVCAYAVCFRVACWVRLNRYIDSANHCAGNFPPDESELVHSNLTPVASEVVAPPRIAEAAVQMECTVDHFHEIKNDAGRVSATSVFCRVRRFHVADEVFDHDKQVVDFDRMGVIGRLGGNWYATLGGAIEIGRPKWDAEAGKCVLP